METVPNVIRDPRVSPAKGDVVTANGRKYTVLDYSKRGDVVHFMSNSREEKTGLWVWQETVKSGIVVERTDLPGK